MVALLTVAAGGRSTPCEGAANESQENKVDEHQPDRGRRGVLLYHPRLLGSSLPSCVCTWIAKLAICGMGAQLKHIYIE